MQHKRIPVQDFFRNPEKAEYKISPDGQYYAFLAPFKGRLNVFVQKRENAAAQRLTSDTTRDIISYLWADGRRLLYLQDAGGDENHKLFSVDINGGNCKSLTDFDGVKTMIIDELKDHDGTVIVGLNRRDARIFDPYRLDVESGEMTLLAENPGNVIFWMLDHEGKLRLAFTSDGVNTSLLHRRREADDFQTVLSLGFKDQLRPLLFTFDNERIFATSNLGRDTAALVEFDLENATETRELYAHPDYDVASLLYSRKRKCLLAAEFTSWKDERHVFDTETGEIFERLSDQLGAYEIDIADMDRNEESLIVRTHSDRSRGAYYLYDKRALSIEKLAELSPWLDERDMAPVEPIQFTARDGLDIHGYLTLPPNVAAENLPVVVFPHGGPWYRDTWRFDPNVQFLANRGYAVLQVNFRGSTGYGKTFWEASFKQWGPVLRQPYNDEYEPVGAFSARRGAAGIAALCQGDATPR